MDSQELLDLANDTARLFYQLQGYSVPVGYQFQNATHPMEVIAWRQVGIAFELLRETDIQCVIEDVEDE